MRNGEEEGEIESEKDEKVNEHEERRDEVVSLFAVDRAWYARNWVKE